MQFSDELYYSHIHLLLRGQKKDLCQLKCVGNTMIVDPMTTFRLLLITLYNRDIKHRHQFLQNRQLESESFLWGAN